MDKQDRDDALLVAGVLLMLALFGTRSAKGINPGSAGFNPAVVGPYGAFSNNNRTFTATQPTGDELWSSTLSLISHSSGKWYAEFKNGPDSENSAAFCGFSQAGKNLATYMGGDAVSWGMQDNTNGGAAALFHGGSIIGFLASLGFWGANIDAGLAIDLDAGKAWISIEGAYATGADPSTGANPTFVFPANTATRLGAAVSSISSPLHSSVIADFRTRDFVFAPPDASFMPWAGA